MLTQKKWSGPGMLALVAVVSSLWVATPVLAGTVYSWTTDDGTFAYTDDPKRVPAKYRATASAQDVGRITDYERFTPVPSTAEKPYAERLVERLVALRTGAEPKPEVRVRAAGARPADQELSYRLPVGGGGPSGEGADVSIALGGAGGAGDEPTVIDNVRVWPEDSMATRFVTIVRKGDQIQTVIREELNEMNLQDFPRERDLGIDEAPWR